MTTKTETVSASLVTEDAELRLSGEDCGFDRFGRAISGYAKVEPASEYDLKYYGLPEGWNCQIYATRNGERYGASPPSKTFATKEEACAHGARGLKAQAARYRRLLANGKV